ncbi:MAG: phosphoglucomutase/phosphomannomutase family protein, partial [Cyanobacteria bacterium P01_H01_bin.130]
GGSVSGDVTQKVEAKLDTPAPDADTPGTITSFHPKDTGYFEALREYVDIAAIQGAIAQGKLTVFADAMHGSSAGGLAQILDTDQVREFNGDRDPLFKGGAPEPLPKYLQPSLDAIGKYGAANPEQLVVGLVFDGDCDRIGAVDRHGNFLSTQNLIPILIEHLASRREMTGEVIKTVSGSDLMPKVAALFDLSVYETAVGYKYIADRMLSVPTLIGGEESGGVGYGCHIPERDALLSALYVLETVVKSGKDLSDLYADLQKRTGFDSAYDRTDLPLADMATRDRLLDRLANDPPTTIAGEGVNSCQTTDGYKFRLTDGRWLMIRFSGTEPVLRLYCEAATLDDVHATLRWAETWATEG